MDLTTADNDDITLDLNQNSRHAGEHIPLVPFPADPGDRSDGIPVSTHPADSDASSRVTINVGGGVFQTSKETFQKGIAQIKGEVSGYYDPTRNEYFFDRDPEIFRCVLHYWRTDQLHLPTTKCGAQIKEELEMWGLGEKDVKSCCWSNYHSWMRTIESLKKLERDRRPAYLQDKTLRKSEPTTVCGRHKLALWNVLTDPSYSKAAKVYAYVALVFVVLAIFSYCASTHKFFQIPDIDNNNKPDNSSLTSSAKGDNINKSSIIIPYDEPNNSSEIEMTENVESETREGRRVKIHPALVYIDYICLVFFTVEYVTRIFCAPKPCRFIFCPIGIIDLLAILPDYVELIMYVVHPEVSSPHAVLEFMPFLRLMRAFRIFRLIRRVPGLWLMMYTLKASIKELSLMLIFLIVGTIFFSSIIYFVDDPDVFTSIPQSFWWAIVTMTTVGYGDVTPRTAWGQLVGSFTAVSGVLIIGFTIPALVNNFITYYNHVEFVIRKEKLMSEEENLTNEKSNDPYNGQIYSRAGE